MRMGWKQRATAPRGKGVAVYPRGTNDLSRQVRVSCLGNGVLGSQFLWPGTSREKSWESAKALWV